MKVSTQGELVAHDPYNPPTLAVRAVDAALVVLARLAALRAEIRRRPELERHASRAVPPSEPCPVRSLLLIDVCPVHIYGVAALERRVDGVDDALSRLKYVLATPDDAGNTREVLLEKRRLASAG